jgi:FkbM family methyltransferase
MIEKAKQTIRKIIPYRLYIIFRELNKIKDLLQKTRHSPNALNIRKYREYIPAGGMGDKLQIYIDYIKNGTVLEIKNVFEIGANFAQDADYLMEQFELEAKDIYVFEAHPEIYKAIKKIHKFNAFNNAVFNEESEIEFNINPLDYKDTGWSSIFIEGIEKIKVKAIRMDSFMERNNIREIDFLKIDVEGATYHVLEGFGERIKDIKCIQLEAEHGEAAVIPYEEISKKLIENDFDLIHFARFNDMRQSDSFWINKKYVNKKQR